MRKLHCLQVGSTPQFHHRHHHRRYHHHHHYARHHHRRHHTTATVNIHHHSFHNVALFFRCSVTQSPLPLPSLSPLQQHCHDCCHLCHRCNHLPLSPLTAHCRHCRRCHDSTHHCTTTVSSITLLHVALSPLSLCHHYHHCKILISKSFSDSERQNADSFSRITIPKRN